MPTRTRWEHRYVRRALAFAWLIFFPVILGDWSGSDAAGAVVFVPIWLFVEQPVLAVFALLVAPALLIVSFLRSQEVDGLTTGVLIVMALAGLFLCGYVALWVAIE